MSNSPEWGKLPDPALANVYKFLGSKDLLNAASTCWHWRSALFQKRFFKNFKFKLDLNDEGQFNFFVKKLLHITSELVLIFDLVNIYHIDKIRRILYSLAATGQILGLRFQTNTVGLTIPGEKFTEDDVIDIEQTFIEPLKLILARRVPPMKVIDFGGIEGLTYYALDFLTLLNRPQELQELTLASVKYDPSHYPILAVESVFFEKCVSLQVLSLDYDTLNDDVLRTLQILPLKKFMICVHGVDREHRGISEAAWATFASKMKNLKLILTLIYAYEAVEDMQVTLLRRNMPLTHLRVIFCNYINIEALDLMSQNYKDTLRSIHWVDSPCQDLDRNIMALYLRAGQDPFVMMSWLCKYLEEIVIHGYVLDPHNLVGISRLRGKNLKKLEVLMLDDYPESYWGPIVKEISAQLGQDWLPMDPSRVHPAIGLTPVQDDCRDAYVLELIRSDLASN